MDDQGGRMNCVCIVCEGATEVEFVEGCLAPHLMDHGVSAYPSILRAPSGGHRGGRVSVERLARFLSHQWLSGRAPPVRRS
ncbi:hypothetical protein [Tistrella mobilis]